MGKNHRPKTTVTRSVSFNEECFALLESRRKALRLSRSRWINQSFEHLAGILDHPEIMAGPDLEIIGDPGHQTGAVTRSISFKLDVFDLIESGTVKLRLPRAALVNKVLEHAMGVRPHADIITMICSDS